MNTCPLCNEPTRIIRTIGPAVKFYIPCPPAPDHKGIDQGPIIMFPVQSALDGLCYFHNKKEKGLFEYEGGRKNILDYVDESR